MQKHYLVKIWSNDTGWHVSILWTNPPIGETGTMWETYGLATQNEAWQQAVIAKSNHYYTGRWGVRRKGA
jgi:hypothetical protein